MRSPAQLVEVKGYGSRAGDEEGLQTFDTASGGQSSEIIRASSWKSISLANPSALFCWNKSGPARRQNVVSWIQVRAGMCPVFRSWNGVRQGDGSAGKQLPDTAAAIRKGPRRCTDVTQPTRNVPEPFPDVGKPRRNVPAVLSDIRKLVRTGTGRLPGIGAGDRNLPGRLSGTITGVRNVTDERYTREAGRFYEGLRGSRDSSLGRDSRTSLKEVRNNFVSWFGRRGRKMLFS